MTVARALRRYVGRSVIVNVDLGALLAADRELTAVEVDCADVLLCEAQDAVEAALAAVAAYQRSRAREAVEVQVA